MVSHDMAPYVPFHFFMVPYYTWLSHKNGYPCLILRDTYAPPYYVFRWSHSSLQYKISSFKLSLIIFISWCISNFISLQASYIKGHVLKCHLCPYVTLMFDVEYIPNWSNHNKLPDKWSNATQNSYDKGVLLMLEINSHKSQTMFIS